MVRSIWKLPFISKNLSLNSVKANRQIIKIVNLKRIRQNDKFINIKLLKNIISFKPFLCSRSSMVSNSLVGFKVKIYNGKIFKPITITRDMIGFKYGAFILTRKSRNSVKYKKN